MTEEHSAADRLKARLTGAVALLVIGVIGWFWLLGADNPIEPVAQESAIPPAPAIQPFAVPTPTPPADIKPVGSERDAPVVAEVEPAPETAPATVEPPPPSSSPDTGSSDSRLTKPGPAQPKPASAKPTMPAPVPAKPKPAPAVKPAATPEKFEMDSNSLPVAWVVQVGAMGSQAAADKLKAQLISKGFKAFTQSGKLANGNSVIKVFVGPKLSRERADAQKKALDTALKTTTMVVRFPPG